MDTDSADVIDFGVDYITVTATVKPKSLTLADVAREHLQREANAGNEVRQWRGLTYNGWTCGSVSYGVGPQGTLARMSSGIARENWKELYTWGMKCTRLDLQVTVRSNTSAPEVLRSQWKSAVEKWNTTKGRREPECFVGPSGIHTITLGARQSDSCGRAYDKGFESKLDFWQDCVRYEAEFKGLRSNALCSALYRQGCEFAVVNSHVSRFFRKRGVVVPIASDSQLRILLPAVTSSVARKLRYIRKSVGPMAAFLVSQDKLPELIEALQLGPFVTINPRVPDANLDHAQQEE